MIIISHDNMSVGIFAAVQAYACKYPGIVIIESDFDCIDHGIQLNRCLSTNETVIVR